MNKEEVALELTKFICEHNNGEFYSYYNNHLKLQDDVLKLYSHVYNHLNELIKD